MTFPRAAQDPAAKGATTAAGSKKDKEKSGFCQIANKSRRPVRRVACRLILDGRAVRAGMFSIADPAAGGQYFPASPDHLGLAAGEYLHLLAGQQIGARFLIPEEVENFHVARYVIRFTDDADRRWELDGNMHLVLAPDKAW